MTAAFSQAVVSQYNRLSRFADCPQPKQAFFDTEEMVGATGLALSARTIPHSDNTLGRPLSAYKFRNLLIFSIIDINSSPVFSIV